MYGYDQSDASTGANSVRIKYNGKMTVVLATDPKNHIDIIYPNILLQGTTMGKRTSRYEDKVQIIDYGNDLLLEANFNPVNHPYYKKQLNKKELYPDYFV